LVFFTQFAQSGIPRSPREDAVAKAGCDLTRFRAAWTAMSDDPTYLPQLEPILEGMRVTGAPEH
jgi:hypothetical protein